MSTSFDRTGPSTASGRILVTGATGDIGGHLAQALHDRGATFAVMCRKAEQRASFEKRGIETVAGDFSDPRSLDAAMDGVTQLFLLAPGGSISSISTLPPSMPPRVPGWSTW